MVLQYSRLPPVRFSLWQKIKCIPSAKVPSGFPLKLRKCHLYFLPAHQFCQHQGQFADNVCIHLFRQFDGKFKSVFFFRVGRFYRRKFRVRICLFFHHIYIFITCFSKHLGNRNQTGAMERCIDNFNFFCSIICYIRIFLQASTLSTNFSRTSSSIICKSPLSFALFRPWS